MELKKSTSRTVWIAIGVLYGLFVLTLVIVKLYNPDMSLSRVFWWVIAGTLVFGAAAALVYYGGTRAAALAQHGKLPPAITVAQARLLAMDALRDPMYMDEIDLDQPVDAGSSDEGHPPSQVYRLVGKSKHLKSVTYAIGINMHFPDHKRRILVNPKNDYEIQRMIQKLAAFPRDEPIMKETDRINPDTGLIIRTKEPVVDEKKEEESKKDELDK